ncbi:MAG: CotH kinase family protein [Bacteroidales bacterium]|nr:CotH kinase family protein [Bacteroidales bacterium]
MRTRLTSLILLASLAFACSKDPVPEQEGQPSRSDLVKAGTEYVFDSLAVSEIHISISSAEWKKLLDAYDKNSNTREYVCARMVFVKDGEMTVVDSIGLRLKGNTSRRRPQDGNGRYRHVHFGIDTDRYVEDRDLKGLRRFDLKWFKDDPAYVREIYCYDLFRRSGVWTGLRDVYTRLWLKVGSEKEIYYGVYGLLEHINKDYLRIRKDAFGGKDGNIWKCAHGANLANVNADFGQDDGYHDHTYVRKTGSEEDYPQALEQIKDFVGKINTMPGAIFHNWISTVMDVDLFLKTYAVNVAVGMWDDYWNNSNNFYLYFNSNDPSNYKVWFIPYDYDNTLGTCLNCGVQSDAGRQNPYNWGSANNPLVKKILENSAWKQTYKRYLQELCCDGGLSSPEVATARIASMQALIKDYVANDTGDDNYLYDSPAYWGSHGEYRIMSSGPDNFFTVKAAVVSAMK